MRLKTVATACILATAAWSASALTLGRVRGAAWIGQPLDLTVAVQTDPGPSDGNLCTEVDVFHGDSRQEGSRVQLLPGEQADTVNLRISSPAMIDEPVVTIYLRAGCSNKVSRKYVLLAEFPNDAAAPPSRSTTPTAPEAPLVIPVESASTSANAPATGGNLPGVAAAVARNTKAQVPVTKDAAAPVAREASRQAAKEANQQARKEAAATASARQDSTAHREGADKPAGSGKPRLRLDPIEALNERVKSLESSAPTAPLQSVAAQDDQKMQALQGDLKTLLDHAVKNEASLIAMRERLEKAESERVPVAVVYGLAALVLLCMGALAYLLLRRPRRTDLEAPSVPPAMPSAAAIAAAPVAASSASESAEMDVDLLDMDSRTFNELMYQPEANKQG